MKVTKMHVACAAMAVAVLVGLCSHSTFAKGIAQRLVYAPAKDLLSVPSKAEPSGTSKRPDIAAAAAPHSSSAAPGPTAFGLPSSYVSSLGFNSAGWYVGASSASSGTTASSGSGSSGGSSSGGSGSSSTPGSSSEAPESSYPQSASSGGQSSGSQSAGSVPSSSAQSLSLDAALAVYGPAVDNVNTANGISYNFTETLCQGGADQKNTGSVMFNKDADFYKDMVMQNGSDGIEQSYYSDNSTLYNYYKFESMEFNWSQHYDSSARSTYTMMIDSILQKNDISDYSAAKDSQGYHLSFNVRNFSGYSSLYLLVGTGSSEQVAVNSVKVQYDIDGSGRILDSDEIFGFLCEGQSYSLELQKTYTHEGEKLPIQRPGYAQ